MPPDDPVRPPADNSGKPQPHCPDAPSSLPLESTPQQDLSPQEFPGLQYRFLGDNGQRYASYPPAHGTQTTNSPHHPLENDVFLEAVPANCLVPQQV